MEKVNNIKPPRKQSELSNTKGLITRENLRKSIKSDIKLMEDVIGKHNVISLQEEGLSFTTPDDPKTKNWRSHLRSIINYLKWKFDIENE